MNKAKYFFLFLVYFSLDNLAQVNIPELQKFSDVLLFNPKDTSCFNVSGEWTGEEIQYDPTESFIKVKFKVVFQLSQEGNRVYGTSFIQDKFRRSHGDMKIRGMVIGNKLHFEEYEIIDEKFFEKGVVWCLRSGEMALKQEGNKLRLEGRDYSGYASDNYTKCTDYVKMSVSKSIEIEKQEKKPNELRNKIVVNKMDIVVFPNPCAGEATLSYDLSKSSQIQIEIFSLSGAKMETILNSFQESGSHKIPIHLSSYVAGVYLVRFLGENFTSTKQVVKTN